MLRRVFRRLGGRLDLALPSDTAFLERAYREVLGREIDQDGLNYYKKRLSEGERRGGVLLSLATSAVPALPSLRAARPERYRREPAIDRALHPRYDAYMDKRSLARKAYFVFSKGATPERNRAVVERIERSSSKALA